MRLQPLLERSPLHSRPARTVPIPIIIIIIIITIIPRTIKHILSIREPNILRMSIWRDFLAGAPQHRFQLFRRPETRPLDLHAAAAHLLVRVGQLEDRRPEAVHAVKPAIGGGRGGDGLDGVRGQVVGARPREPAPPGPEVPRDAPRAVERLGPVGLLEFPFEDRACEGVEGVDGGADAGVLRGGV